MDEPLPALPRSRRFARIAAGAWLVMLLVISVRVAARPEHQSVHTVDYAPAGRQWLHSGEVYRAAWHFPCETRKSRVDGSGLSAILKRASKS